MKYCMIVVAMMSACVFGQPAPELGETVDEYFDRYEAWVDSIPEDQRAWVEVEAIDQRFKELYDGPRLAKSPEEDGWDQSVRFVEANRDLIDRIIQVSRVAHLAIPRSVFKNSELEDAPQALGLLLPQLGMLMRQESLLMIESQVAYEQGDLNRAIECLESAYRLGAFAPLANSTIEMLVEIAMSSLAINPVIEGRLGLSELSDAQLVRLSNLHHTPERVSLAEAGSSEHWVIEDLLSWFYQDSKDGRLTLDGAKRLIKITKLIDSLPDGEKTFDELFNESIKSDTGLGAMLIGNMVLSLPKQQQAAANFFDAVQTDFRTQAHLLKSFRSAAVMDELTEKEFKYAPVAIFVVDFQRLYGRWAAHQTEKSAFQILVAIHRYKLRHGSFPVSLESIDSDLLVVEVVDPYTNKPMRYMVVDGQPVIYSVGPDRDDDGGESILDEDGDPDPWPDFLTLDELDALDDAEREVVDGDWVLYPAVR